LKSREKFLAVSDWTDSVARMIQSGFLSEVDRMALTALARVIKKSFQFVSQRLSVGKEVRLCL
jgi:hypothetical protein